MIDKIISHYKVIEKLGEGGMGVLYLAEDLELNRKAVLKFLPPDMMNDPDTNLRFKTRSTIRRFIKPSEYSYRL